MFAIALRTQLLCIKLVSHIRPEQLD